MPLAGWRSGFRAGLGRGAARPVPGPGSGRFLLHRHRSRDLIQRPKPAHDDALPAGNGIATQVLLKLGRLTGRMDYLEAAERTLRLGLAGARTSSHACNAMLAALEDFRTDANDRAARPTGGVGGMVGAVRPTLRPASADAGHPATAAVPAGLLAERRTSAAPVTAYVCTGLNAGRRSRHSMPWSGRWLNERFRAGRRCWREKTPA